MYGITYSSKEEKKMPHFKPMKQRLTLLLGGVAHRVHKVKQYLIILKIFVH